MPNLIGVQVESYDWFITEGLKEVFRDVSPIKQVDGKLELEFLEHRLCRDEIKYSIEECKERDATYSAPLRVKIRFRNHESGVVVEMDDIFMGDLPLMTKTGTFVINGAERVIVSQLVRSPGIYYSMERDRTGLPMFACQVIPNRGAWLEYSTDANGCLFVEVDRARKIPITVLLRALLGMFERPEDPTMDVPVPGTNESIIAKFGNEEKLLRTFDKDKSTTYEEGLLALYDRMRPGEPAAVETAEAKVRDLFFDSKKYDLAKVGRYKFNKKLALKNRIDGLRLAEDVLDPEDGTVLYEKGTELTREDGKKIQDAGVDHIVVAYDYNVNTASEDGESETLTREVTILSNMMVDIRPALEKVFGDNAFDPDELGINEDVYYPVLKKILKGYRSMVDDSIKYEIVNIITNRVNGELDNNENSYEDIEAQAAQILNYIKNDKGREEMEDLLRKIVNKMFAFDASKDMELLKAVQIVREKASEFRKITVKELIAAASELVEEADVEGNGSGEKLDQLHKAILKEEIRNNVADLIPKHITKDDIFASINYNLHLEYNIGTTDDIDHLGNRRIRSVGELLQDKYRIGIMRLERVVKERMQTQDIETITPHSLINIKPVTSAVKEFFGSSQLSQFMDQNNPLSELTHKRRLSALGPGGLSRDRAGVEVRDVHYTHYGRMCPIETPEGPNIGLINSLATYARINSYGFVEAPYRRVDKTDPENPVVTDEVVYMTADEEDNYIVVQASEPLDENGHFERNNVAARYRDLTSEFPRKDVDFMDVSPRMVFSVATSMVPFLQNDDTTRALMGSNMQRQAVPLLKTDSPVVGTGMEEKTAIDSGVCILAKRAGTVEISSSEKIVIRPDESPSEEDVYVVTKFARSNQGNCMNQRPIVVRGDKVKAGEVIADGASTCNGELALGKNPLIGFMTWEGYNYEDAVLLSERLVKEDVYTSVHIEEYECEARDTKLGPEEITRDLANLGNDVLDDLNEDGIVRIGAEVRAGDILVGKVTPKGETELTAEERLLRAIFGEKAREVRDTSLRLPHGAYGIVMDTKVFTRENSSDLAPGVNVSVRVYVAQKRKISVGDKMAGRHGNKGVVSRVLPVEDMPFLPNGRPLDIVLNPLGVPSRMNIGQVLELHLGLAAQALGFKISTPIFDGANEKDISAALELANDYVNSEWEDFEKKYKDELEPEVLQYLYDNRDHREEWKGVQIDKDGKVELRDGRTGEPFPSRVSIGFMHYLKLHHLVDDKIHARSVGPYSLVTQQPLGGKAQFGGQRFGEMEVWALEAYGASYTLQEILTVKSDDVAGRVKTYEAIIKGENIPKPGVPESFKVLLKEFQSLGLDVRVLDEDRNEVSLSESIEYDQSARSDMDSDLEEFGSGYGSRGQDYADELDDSGFIGEDENGDAFSLRSQDGDDLDDDFSDAGDFDGSDSDDE